MMDFNINITPLASLEQAVKYCFCFNTLRDNIISSQTYERVKVAKTFIENKYKMKKVEEMTKKKGLLIIVITFL